LDHQERWASLQHGIGACNASCCTTLTGEEAATTCCLLNGTSIPSRPGRASSGPLSFEHGIADQLLPRPVSAVRTAPTSMLALRASRYRHVKTKAHRKEALQAAMDALPNKTCKCAQLPVPRRFCYGSSHIGVGCFNKHLDK